MAASKAGAIVYRFLVVAYLVGAVAGIGGRLDAPHIGVAVEARQDGTLVIQRVHPGGAAWEAGARTGDLLIDVDGIRPDEVRWVTRGDRGINFVILRPDTGELLQGSTSARGIFSLPLSISLEIIGVVFAACSLAIFSRTRRSPQVLVLALLLIVSGIEFSVTPAAGQWLPWALFVSNITVPWVAALFLGFFSLFPTPVTRTKHALVSLLIITAALAVALNLVYFVAIWILPPAFPVFSRGWFGYIASAIAGGLVLLVRSYWVEKSPIAREQLRIIVFATAFAVLPFILISILPRAVGAEFFVQPEVTILATAVVPLAFAYAILRHHLMGIRRLVHRSVAYATISLAVFLGYSLLVMVTRNLAGDDIASSTALQAMLLVLLFVAVPAMTGTRRLAYATVDRLLYKEPSDYPTMVRRLSAGVVFINNFDELGSTILSTMVHDFGLSFAAILRVTDIQVSVLASGGKVLDDLAHSVVPVLNGNAPRYPTVVRSDSAGPASGVVLIDLTKRQSQRLLFCLGPKVTEEPFRRDELDAIGILAAHMATTVEKLQLLDELKANAATLRELNRRLLRAQEDERRRIGEYLHGEPIQLATYLAWQAEHFQLPAMAQGLLAALIETLRNFTMLLRPAVLDDLGMVRALDWLTNQMAASGGFHCALSVNGIHSDERFDHDVELAVYRVAQEALRNCQKHARATAVSVTLERMGENLELTIDDNGIGLNQLDIAEQPGKLGIAGMRERVEQLDGSFRISSLADSTGTRVAVTLPATPRADQPSTTSVSRQRE